MTPRQKIEQVLRGDQGSLVPFTMYECMIPQCVVEREMRNRGLCIVERSVPVFKTHRPNVRVTQHVYWEGERKMRRTVYETPVGTVSLLGEDVGFTVWWHEKLFKTADDYKTILFLIQDEVYEPNYEEFARAQDAFGEDAIFRADIGPEPLQALVSGIFMNMQTFCLEWMDNRDEILKLYQAFVENKQKIYPLVAQSPACHANYGGNVAPEIIGSETFERYYVPHYNEAAEILHKHGKLIGCHFDANCKMIAEGIARTDLDYVEAFTPAPDTDMTLSEARAAWPDKVLWLNFPSSAHLKSDAEVELITVDLLNELARVEGIIMGVTEDMPQNRWQGSCRAIMDGLERHAKESPELYTI